MPKIITGGNKLNNNLFELGLNEEIIEEFKQYYKDGYIGRVITEYKGMYKVITENDIILSQISGKISFEAVDRNDYPAVGDWVVLDRDRSDRGNAVIHGTLQRKSKLSRKVAGTDIDEQIIASNIDIIFICMSLNQDFNLRKLERYISIAWNSGGTPVVVLTKSDLCEDISEKLTEVEKVAIGIDIIHVSSLTYEGLEELKKYLTFGKTVVFIGSSGVGKSSLINLLLGQERLKTNEIRESDDRGKHTTTHRELILLPEGGVVIDTPGMREIQLLDEEESIEDAFSDITEISKHCRFSDCKHDKEPGCAVVKAIEEGVISKSRLDNYNKLKKEAEFIKRKMDRKAELKYKKEIIRRNKKIRNNNKI